MCHAVFPLRVCTLGFRICRFRILFSSPHAMQAVGPSGTWYIRYLLSTAPWCLYLSTPLGFYNVPVTKFLMLFIGSCSLLASILNYKQIFHLQLSPHITIHHQVFLFGTCMNMQGAYQSSVLASCYFPLCIYQLGRALFWITLTVFNACDRTTVWQSQVCGMIYSMARIVKKKID